MQEEFYQARKKLGDESKNLPAGVMGPMINDEFADVTFALFALKAKGEPQRLLVRDAESLRQQLLHVLASKSEHHRRTGRADLYRPLMTVWRRWGWRRRIFSTR